MEDPKRFTWAFRQKDIRAKIDGGNLETLFTWPVTTEALYSMDWTIAEPELAVIQKSPLWPQYQLGIRSFKTGNPVRTQHTDIDPHLVLQAYHIEQLLRYGSLNIESVYEFGGGFGGMALLMRRMGFTGRYVIQDLPEMGEIQRFFLNGEGIHDVEFTTSSISGQFSLFISNCAIEEIDGDSRKVLERIWSGLDADYYEMCYTAFWDGRTTTEYMKALASDRSEIHWIDYEDQIYSNHRYMIGVRR